MPSPTPQLSVLVRPRPGDASADLPARLAAITGRSRTQITIELQRGEVELLRTHDRDAVEQMVARAASEGLLAVVREIDTPADASPSAGWGSVLGAFDSRVAVAPSRAAASERYRPAAESAFEPPELRLGEQPAVRLETRPIADEPAHRPSYIGRDEDDVPLPGMAGVGVSVHRKPAQRAGAAPASRRLPVRAPLVVGTLLLLAALGFAVQRKLRATFATATTEKTSLAEPSGSGTTVDSAEIVAPKHAPEQVRRLVDEARDACRNGDFERCKALADEALNLDETNRAAQAVHIRAVTALSARAGQPAATSPSDGSP